MQSRAERLSPVDPGIRRGITDLYPSRGYTHPVTRAIVVSHAACVDEILSKSCLVDLTAKVSAFFHVFSAYTCSILHIILVSLYCAVHIMVLLFFTPSIGHSREWLCNSLNNGLTQFCWCRETIIFFSLGAMHIAK